MFLSQDKKHLLDKVSIIAKIRDAKGDPVKLMAIINRPPPPPPPPVRSTISIASPQVPASPVATPAPPTPVNPAAPSVPGIEQAAPATGTAPEGTAASSGNFLTLRIPLFKSPLL